MIHSWLLLLGFLVVSIIANRRPVVFMHGLFGSYTDFDKYIALLKESHPDQLTFSLDIFNGVESSINPIAYQIVEINERIREIKAKYSEQFKNGFILVGHSQGALITSNVIKIMNDHGVYRMISLAGPLNGQYGIPEEGKYVPDIIANVTKEYCYKILYTSAAQNHVSFSNYWKDPNHMGLYLEHNSFLPIAQNETTNPLAQQYKENFLKVHDIHLFGSSADEIIKPWFSEFYGFYNEHEEKVDMEDQYIYKHDTFGLKTMHDQNRLFMTHVDGVRHTGWTQDVDVIKEHVLPLLDC